ncbi:MAG TPA: translation elongation factor 4 [Thermoanaerobaculales bacterium]|nr:translation elongation factor 4 [Thermoanaerobaculales bacterium]HPA80136.1 translation elongation factor 4 [Thermoanaerobaculales bacterium]HQL30278.1 translation elongation factor 4 [Thermoanaerobaculales bacterium]HQN94957.1 translation elongation factor 4 [Thermoanaerobaculales bacterium]HQP42527.1 translation elongation factor 4 [Thermoanaerobaculales bacterium]
MDNVRTFCIIAHIDHGKSTLADRLIQHCGAVEARDFRDQILDSMDIERERGITIKSNSVTLDYVARDGRSYHLNLIDTPGHVDFSHEVRRSLMSCEGALLLVDASQGVEAQTVANLYLALEYDLEIVPVINKIDLPSADVERVRAEIEEDLGLDADDAVLCSAKDGVGIADVLEAVVHRLPPPTGDLAAPLKALIFDAEYDPYRGAVLLVRVMEGTLRPGQQVLLMHTQAHYQVEEVGLLQLRRVRTAELGAGAVGYLIAGVKAVSDIDVGDTVTEAERPAAEPVPGYRPAKPVVFSSIYPMSNEEYPDLAKALEKLKLNDAALTYDKDSSAALGFGFRCGFLGLLHLEVVQERLRREHDLSLILSAPSVRYRVTLADGSVRWIDNPSEFPEPGSISRTEEPFIRTSVMMPERYLGPVMELCRERRGVKTGFHYLAVGRVELTSEMPLADVLFDFNDRLKSVTQGYGSFDYEMLDYRDTDLVKVDILVNGEPVDALAQLVHRDKARPRALHYCERLAETIPRQQFKIAIQGAIGGQIIARTTINAFRKDVTAKCYGGDITRKRKLLEKQKKGKKRMKMVGSVEIPQSAFVAVLKTDKD